MKIKAALLAAACMACVNHSHAAIQLEVTGGINSPLTVQILEGDVFLTTDADTGVFLVVFENFWNSSSSGFSGGYSTDTISMTTATSSAFTGAYVGGIITAADLTLGFNGSGFTSGLSMTLGTGTRTTSNSLMLDYTSINASGNAYIYRDTDNIASGPIAWSAVPEPSTYAAMFATAALGLACWRRRKTKA